VNTLLYAAALCALGLGVAHSILGELYILKPLLARGGLSDFRTRTVRLAWHVTSIAWFGFAALLMLLVQPLMTYRSVALVVAVTYFGTAVFTLFVSRGRHLAWPVMAFIGGVAYTLAVS
jgi:hypothetical protein